MELSEDCIDLGSDMIFCHCASAHLQTLNEKLFLKSDYQGLQALYSSLLSCDAVRSLLKLLSVAALFVGPAASASVFISCSPNISVLRSLRCASFVLAAIRNKAKNFFSEGDKV